MITEVELRIRQTAFEPERQANQAEYHSLEKLRRQFVSRFPPSRIASMSLDDYVEGKGNNESFCYWVEWKTSELGRIQGTPAKRFGVYYDKKTKQYKTILRFSNENEAIAFYRQQITRLLEAGRSNDKNLIRQVEISPMFKGKILFLYYPTRFLNVFSEDHVDHFLREIGFPKRNGHFDILAKRELLLDFKIHDEVMSAWTTIEFMWFLYRTWPPLPKRSEVPLALRKYVDAQIFPHPEDVKAEFISFEISQVSSRQYSPKSHSGAIDFEEQNQRNKRIGDQGEDVVYWLERNWLSRNGKNDFAKNVEQTCRSDPGAGYDIKSFELDGTPKYIEVKSTTSKQPSGSREIRFHLSAKEFQQAKDLPNYYLFVVFDVRSTKPKIWPIQEPAKLPSGQLHLRPSAYHATLSVARPIS